MQPEEKRYSSVQEMLDDSGCPEVAEEFRKREPYRKLVEAIRKWWSFDNGQQHTHSWHDREDFIDKALPQLIEAITTAASDNWLPDEPAWLSRLANGNSNMSEFVAKEIAAEIREMFIYKRAVESMARQMIHPKMTAKEMAEMQLKGHPDAT